VVFLCFVLGGFRFVSQNLNLRVHWDLPGLALSLEGVLFQADVLPGRGQGSVKLLISFEEWCWKGASTPGRY